MFESLRHFVLVARHGTFTAAARHAHLSQPALTASIQRLESAVGARLFVRGRGGPRAVLTAAGDALLPRARSALAAVDEGRRAVAEIMQLEAGEVRLGAGATVCSYYLPRFLARFRARFPKVRIHLREGTQESLLERQTGWLPSSFRRFPSHRFVTPPRNTPVFFVVAPRAARNSAEILGPPTRLSL